MAELYKSAKNVAGKPQTQLHGRLAVQDQVCQPNGVDGRESYGPTLDGNPRGNNPDFLLVENALCL